MSFCGHVFELSNQAMKKYYRRILYFVLAILLGVLMFIYGEYDDSPGGQLLGLLVAISGIIGLVKNKKKTSN